MALVEKQQQWPPPPDWIVDLEAIRGLPGLSGVMLAETESADQVNRTAAGLPDIPSLALIESAWGSNSFSTSPRRIPTTRRAFGTGDFRRHRHAGR